MTPYFQTELGKLFNGDCLEVMGDFPSDSISSILTDPPYGLKFMGKAWDHGIPGVPFWTEALRIAKPGAHLLAFGGTRTFHRLMVAIEDAGWEIRDTLMWVYGSGFPKSLDVSKAIDKEAGAEREVVMEIPDRWKGKGNVLQRSTQEAGGSALVTAPSTTAAQQWSGYGTSLKPAWEPVVLARKPLSGTVAQNVQKWGCGAINVDGCRIGTEERTYQMSGAPGGNGQRLHGGDGRDAENARRYAEASKEKPAITVLGRFPANLIHDGSEEVTELFPQSKSTGGKGAASALIDNDSVYGKFSGENKGANAGGLGDSGSAARFFYTAKASRSERGKGNNHPTVKPRALIRYLLKLITGPTDNLILDMFAGSGTVPLECERAGVKWVAIEKEKPSCEIIKNRIETDLWGETEPGQERLFQPMAQKSFIGA